MSKLLVVFGATGNQGSSVVSYVTKNLSDQYKVRAVTRDPSKPSSKALEQPGVEVVKADINDKESVRQALKGADAVFAMSVMAVSPEDTSESVQGKTIADAAIEERVPYFIWSTSADVKGISNGDLSNVRHFDEKYQVEQYIRNLPIKSSFFAPAAFMQNVHDIFAPQPLGDGTYAFICFVKPSAKVPYLDISDTGKYVGALLANPDKLEGEVLYGGSEFYSYEELAAAVSKITGKDVKYLQIPEEKFVTYLPPYVAKQTVEMFKFFEKHGYYPREEVKRSISQALAKPNTLAEYLEKNPLDLK